MAADRHPSQRRYPLELKERAVRLVLELRRVRGQEFGAITEVARELGVGAESLRGWVRQAQIDGAERPGTTSSDRERIVELEREIRELRRSNEILKAASAFFARELDPRPPR